MNISDSSLPRVVRNNKPKKKITKHNYRKVALSALLLDFEHRCAYSMIHEGDAGGCKEMEVDHFNPRHKTDKIQHYTNLYYSSGYCNRSKGAVWPTDAEQSLGIRFLDCCRESDYGKFLFEDPKTHEIVGDEPAAKYHIRILDLNAPHLVQRRRERAELHACLNNMLQMHPKQIPSYTEVNNLLRLIREMLTRAIPQIPPHP